MFDNLKMKNILLILLTFIRFGQSGCPYEKLIQLNENADPETTTPNGCSCNSVCGASAFDAFTNDWCTVNDNCGQYDLTWGYWDYCLYKDSSKPDYVGLDWQIKHDMIWAEIKSDSSHGDYHSVDFMTQSPITSFENEWDILPAGRLKAIHSVGGICPFTLEVSPDSPFTGLLRPGQTITGFIRIGSGADPLGSGVAPGASVKFLRSGTSSANFVVANALDPLNNYNLFSVPLNNHLPDQINDVASIAAAKKSCTTGKCITKVGLSNVCTHDQDGNEDKNPVFPYKFHFDLTGEVNFSEEKPSSMEVFLEQFKDIQLGTRLYTIRAMRYPDDTEMVVLGDIITIDECVSSNYGDTKLFFKHQWVEEDAALKPEWADAYFSECYCNH